MTNIVGRPSLEDVLDEFAMEENTGRSTLERYVLAYPEYACDLVDMSRELGRPIEGFSGQLSERDATAIGAAWELYEAAVPRPLADPWSALSVADLRNAARLLDVPRQVLTAFRERRVEPSSVSDRFLRHLSEALGANAEALRNWMAAPTVGGLARSYKANEKPVDTMQVTFERILLDAGVHPERRADLLSDTE